MNLMTHEKHYNTLTNYYKYKYNKKIAKISLNANFTCPNKDGKVGYGGCTYCSNLGSGDFAGNKNKNLKEQFLEIKEIIEHKWPDTLYIPYLQANTNTYGDLEYLQKIYEEILTFSDKIVSIAIATRPDCLEDEKIQYLANLNNRIPVQIELGLQTIHENTAKLINRGHTLECFDICVKKLRKANIDVVVHIINGLPFETKDMMVGTIDYLNKLDIQGIKIHSLTILKNTKMYIDYQINPFKILTLEEYIDITCEQIAHLNKNIIIHRLSADANKDDLFLPLWTQKKLIVMNEIDKQLRKLNVYQGDKSKY